MIPLISSGFTDKLCEAADIYQRIRATLAARVGGAERREGGREETAEREGGGGGGG